MPEATRAGWDRGIEDGTACVWKLGAYVFPTLGFFHMVQLRTHWVCACGESRMTNTMLLLWRDVLACPPILNTYVAEQERVLPHVVHASAGDKRQLHVRACEEPRLVKGLKCRHDGHVARQRLKHAFPPYMRVGAGAGRVG